MTPNKELIFIEKETTPKYKLWLSKILSLFHIKF